MFSILIRPFGAFTRFPIVTSKSDGTAPSIRVSRCPRLRARWQRDDNGHLHVKWESVAKPATEEDAAPNFPFASRNTSSRTQHSGRLRRRHISNESSHNIATAFNRRHLAA
jgi:hypothetical protein